MSIGAVVVTHNSRDHIRSCIESIQAEGIEEIIVADSLSTDKTPEILTTVKARTIQLPDNRGFGYAANRGAELLSTDYVLFLNPDACLGRGALEIAMEGLRARRYIGAVGLLLRNEQGIPEIASFGREPSFIQLLTRKLARNIVPDSPALVDWVSAGAVIVDRKLFTALGGFDEQFFLYWEDIDLCKRIRGAGYAVMLHPQAGATHVRGASQRDSGVKTAMYDLSADRYYKKHYPTHIWRFQKVLRRIYRIIQPRAH